MRRNLVAKSRSGAPRCVHRMLRRAGPLWAGRCRRENGLAVLPPGKSRGLFFCTITFPAELVIRARRGSAFSAQPPDRLVKDIAFVDREALQPRQRDLVE